MLKIKKISVSKIGFPHLKRLSEMTSWQKYINDYMFKIKNLKYVTST